MVNKPKFLHVAQMDRKGIDILKGFKLMFRHPSALFKSFDFHRMDSDGGMVQHDGTHFEISTPREGLNANLSCCLDSWCVSWFITC